MSERYRTIVADPPWPIYEVIPRWGGSSGNVTRPYPVMTLEEIAALPVKALSDNRDGDAHLYLWAVNEYLESAFGVARAWGFEHSTTLTWCKARTTGIGGTFPSDTEFVLFCRRSGYVSVETRQPREDIAAVTTRIGQIAAAAGYMSGRALGRLIGVNAVGGNGNIGDWWVSTKPKRCAIPSAENWEILRERIPALAELDERVARFNAAKGTVRKDAQRGPRSDSRWFTWPVTEHSRKPEAFLDLVESVSPGPYLELFARRARFGWDYWGDESLGTADFDRPTGTSLDCGGARVT
jgi:N6-adenosine-specific RNA methylase IME4